MFDPVAMIDMVAARAEAGAETETEYLDETTGLQI